MRVRRRLIAALLVATLLASMAVAQDGDESTVDFALHLFVDPPNDESGATATSSAWADVRNGTIHEVGGELIFELEVKNLTGRPDDALWDFGFTTNGTDYTARARWDGSAYTGQILAGDSQIGADTNVTDTDDNRFLRLRWLDFESELADLAVLKSTYGASDQSTLDAPGQSDCHGSPRIDCAPDEGVGDDFPVGHTPAEGLTLSVTPSNATEFPNTTLSFTIDVANRARNFQGFGYNLTLHVQHPDALTSELFGEDITLDPGDAVNRTLDITIPPDATTGVTHDLEITAEPEAGRNRTVVVPISVEAPPPPPPPYALDVRIDPPRRIVGRGESLTYNVTVTNEGANPDIVTLELTDGGDWARLGLHDMTLGSGQSRSIPMTVDVPVDADEQEVRHVVTATSRNDPSVSATGSTTTEVDLPGGFVSDLDRTLQDLGLGGLVPFLVIVAIVVILVLYVLGSAMRRGRVVDVDADFEEEDEADEGTEPGED